MRSFDGASNHARVQPLSADHSPSSSARCLADMSFDPLSSGLAPPVLKCSHINARCDRSARKRVKLAAAPPRVDGARQIDAGDQPEFAQLVPLRPASPAADGVAMTRAFQR
jgi:hypothetical protein